MPAPQDPRNLPIRQQMEALIRRKQAEITQGWESIATVKFHADTGYTSEIHYKTAK